MKYKHSSAEAAKFLRGPQLRIPLTLAAAGILARARGLCPKESTATASSGRLVHGIGGHKNDRIRVSVEFRGHAVALQWGNKRTRATRFLTRAAL